MSDTAIQDVASAWKRYADNSKVSDGHTDACKRADWPVRCTCGFSAVEKAIRTLIRGGAS